MSTPATWWSKWQLDPVFRGPKFSPSILILERGEVSTKPICYEQAPSVLVIAKLRSTKFEGLGTKRSNRRY